MKLKFFIFLAAMSLMTATSLFADEVKQFGQMDGGVTNVFSIEFYTDANVLHGAEGIAFTNIDATSTFCYADGRTSGDGKSDTGVVCRSNLSTPWYLKLSASTSSGFNLANFKYYLGQPWNRTTSTSADGALSQSADWHAVPTVPTTVYTSGTLDQSNLPYGTLATYSYAINPTGLKAGINYSIVLTYTLAETP